MILSSRRLRLPGKRRGRLRGRSADGLCVNGRKQGAGELRDYPAEYRRVVSAE
jgi:hypothetical protein